ncbi:MAG: PAS domain-containing protein [Rhodobacterales bacterium]|nr:PAS domain-containing protein [Rhodobacterales bacterium]
MSFVERRDLNRPSEGEAPFEVGETFFSRTDDRGIILAGNNIFRRVSAYTWDDLVGAPHKIIRHPDMPKGVFHLLWDTIQRGHPIAAYVKNLAKDGLHYWVLAIVLPIEDGFLSVRIKPSCGILATIEKTYATLLQREIEQGLSPEESAAALLEMLVELGFPDYAAFETHVLGEEIISMDQKCGNPPDRSVLGFKEISKSVTDLKTGTSKLAEFFEDIGTIPTNLRILASRLEPSGGPLSALSENYWKMSDEMTTWFGGFIASSGNAFETIQSAINHAMLLKCATRILRETSVQFSQERRKLTGFEIETERDRIVLLAAQYHKHSIEGLLQTEQASKSIAATIDVLRRHILGLNTTRVMCKIESAGLPTGGESLIDIISHFERFQKTAEKNIEDIENCNSIILANTRVIKALK